MSRLVQSASKKPQLLIVSKLGLSVHSCHGGAEGNWWERNFDMLELAKKFTELHYSLENITLLLNSQVEEKEHLIL